MHPKREMKLRLLYEVGRAGNHWVAHNTMPIAPTLTILQYIARQSSLQHPDTWVTWKLLSDSERLPLTTFCHGPQCNHGNRKNDSKWNDARGDFTVNGKELTVKRNGIGAT